MIRTEEIWSEIKRNGLSGYVSRYEIWLKPRELKDFTKKKKILVSLSADVYVYIFLFLLVCVFLAAMIFIFIQKKIFYGTIIALIDVLFIEEILFKRYTAHFHLFENGIIQGIYNKKIARTYHVRYTYLPFSAISKIMVRKDSCNPKLVNVYIITRDNKNWPWYKNYEGISLPLDKEETTHILNYLETVSKQNGFIYERYL